MCTSPISVITNKRYLDTSSIGAFSVFNLFPCGKCPECRKAKQNEYTYRSDSLYRNTIAEGGFCYWETFTYNQDNVPIFTSDEKFYRGVKDFYHNTTLFSKIEFKDFVYVFNSDDYRNFFKRLRINLSRDGYNLFTEVNENGQSYRKNNLKYFFVSEYGGQKGRPHYHCIFYVTIPGLTPSIFYYYLKKSWTLGRLDEDKSPVRKVINGQGAINYVAKYVNKPLFYFPKFQRFFDTNNIDLSLYRDFIPFHRQSQGFGIDIINQQDYQFMFNTGKMIYNDSRGKHIVPIPNYIKRKLWYTLETYHDGKKYWSLTAEGRAFMRNIIHQQVFALSEQYKFILDSIPSLFSPEDSCNLSSSIYDKLNGRDLYDFALYLRLYRGKYIPYNCKNVPPVNIMIDNIIYPLPLDEVSSSLELSLYPYKRFYHNDGTLIQQFGNNFKLSPTTTLLRFACCQDSFSCFNSFDDLFEIFGSIKCKIDKLSNDEYYKKESIKNRLSNLKF